MLEMRQKQAQCKRFPKKYIWDTGSIKMVISESRAEQSIAEVQGTGC